MRCFIVGKDAGDLARLGQVTAGLGLSASTRPAIEALRGARDLHGGRVLVLVAGAERADEAARLAAESPEQVFVVVVAETIPPETYKALVRSGSGDWVQWGPCAVEIAEIVRRFSAPAQEGRTASIVSFLPSKGGVGNTALAVEVAAQISARRGTARVALLDLNFQGGTLADLLDVEARFDLAEIVGRPERLDRQLVEVFTSRHGDRLDIFAPPPRDLPPEGIAPGLIFTVLDAIAPRYDLVLIDLPQVALAWTDTLLQGSDAVVVTGIATVPALRRLSARLAHLDGLGLPRERVLAAVNQAGTDLMGRVLRRAEIERALGAHRALFVRRDAALDEAADSGRPLVETAPDSRIGRDIRRLAAWVEGVAVRPAMPRDAALSRESAA